LTVLVTGGAGFIGANFILDWLSTRDEPIVNFDKLTYAGNLKSLSSILENDRYTFEQGDIADTVKVADILAEFRPTAIVHFAAESHVDRSIYGPEDFIETNVLGTFRLLTTAREYFEQLSHSEREAFRFINVSTDEVFGSLDPQAAPFTESSQYAPNSPYSASKAAADHIARSYFRTYGFPVMTSNCSNNYGPYQFPEKLIPLMIRNGINRKPLPIYGDGLNIRDWLYVTDHCAALRSILDEGRPGETYNIGGNNELTNMEVVNELCGLLDEYLEPTGMSSHQQLISHVEDRLGHDRRYAINISKVERELGWSPTETFSSGLRKTVRWYIDNGAWVDEIESGEYRNWIAKHYGVGAVNQ